MTHVQRSALLPYSVAQMYQLVNDVDSYPEFIPWCVQCDVHDIADNEKQATLYFSSRGIKASVTTNNELIENKKINMELIEGPFKHLIGCWQFHEIDHSSCRVEFEMKFAFSNRVYEKTLGPIFNQVAHKLVSAFAQRAEDLYGGK